MIKKKKKWEKRKNTKVLSGCYLKIYGQDIKF